MKEKRTHHCQEMNVGREGGGRGSKRDGWNLPELNCLPAAVPRPQNRAPPLHGPQDASLLEASLPASEPAPLPLGSQPLPSTSVLA